MESASTRVLAGGARQKILEQPAMAQKRMKPISSGAKATHRVSGKRLPKTDSEVRRALGYLLSIPERSARSTGALAGGLVRELSEVILPVSFRRTKLYQCLVDTTLRFIIEQVGSVERSDQLEPELPADFIWRRTAGNGIEMVGILLFRLSPVWVLAALSDLSGAGRVLIEEISETLKENGLLDRRMKFESVDQILDGLEKTAGRLADNINTLPLNIGTLRREWHKICEEAERIPLKNLPSLENVTGTWRSLKREAALQNCSVFELSSLMALSAASHLPAKAIWLSQSARLAVSRTGSLLAGELLDHYASTLKKIHRTGYLPYWAGQLKPYARAAASHFSLDQSSYTERLFLWCMGKTSSRPG
jgi:hypothetical protein